MKTFSFFNLLLPHLSPSYTSFYHTSHFTLRTSLLPYKHLSLFFSTHIALSASILCSIFPVLESHSLPQHHSIIAFTLILTIRCPFTSALSLGSRPITVRIPEQLSAFFQHLSRDVYVHITTTGLQLGKFRTRSFLRSKHNHGITHS